MKDLLIQIAKALVDNPEQVQVNEIVSTQTVVLELKVAKSDMGKSHRQTGQNSPCHQDFIKCSFWKDSEKIRA